MIKARVIADSKNEFGNRITTMVVTMPRYILAELDTHRMLSRNSASSRAIPFEKMVKSIEETPFIPIAWMKDHKGMQGSEYVTDYNKIEEIKGMWLNARDHAVSSAKYLSTSDLNVTKQIINRLLEPFMYHTVIVTATEWENFFALRCPQYCGNATKEGEPVFRSWRDYVKYAMNTLKANRDVIEQLEAYTILQRLQCNLGQADIHMMATAEAMLDAYNESTPKAIKEGEWHIPFGDNISKTKLINLIADDMGGMDTEINEFEKQIESQVDIWRIKIATARCARVSYTIVGEEEKEPNYDLDIKLHDRLSASGHWSPFEHCAQAMSEVDMWETYGASPHNAIGNGWSGNFKGFIQYRKTFNNENITANDTKRKS